MMITMYVALLQALATALERLLADASSVHMGMFIMEHGKCLVLDEGYVLTSCQALKVLPYECADLEALMRCLLRGVALAASRCASQRHGTAIIYIVRH